MVKHGVWLACAVSLSGCGRIGFDAPSGTGAGWTKTLTLSPAGLGGPLADFPVAIALAADGDLAAHAAADGGDLLFTAADGVTPLPTEIERWDASTGALVAWVQVPVLAVGTTDLVLHYGGSPAGDRHATAVWAGYSGVWHLGDDPAVGLVTDSSGLGNGGHVSGSTTPSRVEGIAGYGLAFDGVDDLVALGNPPNGSFDFGTSSFSYGLWVYTTGHAGEYDTVWYKGGSSAQTPGYDLELGANGWSASVSDGPQINSAAFGNEPEFLGNWVHLVAVVDRGAGRLRTYVDGAERDNADISTFGSLTTTLDAYIGSNPNGPYPFLGSVDEVRVTATALSPDWIAMEHANLADPSFLTVGPAMASP